MKNRWRNERCDVPRLLGKSLYPCANEVHVTEHSCEDLTLLAKKTLHFEAEKLAIENSKSFSQLLGRTTKAVVFQDVSGGVTR